MLILVVQATFMILEVVHAKNVQAYVLLVIALRNVYHAILMLLCIEMSA